jgi:hypothetical protein
MPNISSSPSLVPLRCSPHWSEIKLRKSEVFNFNIDDPCFVLRENTVSGRDRPVVF